jgi:hypothetical protein
MAGGVVEMGGGDEEVGMRVARKQQERPGGRTLFNRQQSVSLSSGVYP